jgi:hypothetical protein
MPEIGMSGSMSGVGKRGLLATAPNLDSTQEAKNLVAQAFQPVQKTLCFLGLFILIIYFNGLSCILKSS